MISENIRRFRQEQKLTQTELAHNAGIGQSTLHYIEEGKRRPRIDIAQKIAQALGVTVEELICGNETKKAS